MPTPPAIYPISLPAHTAQALVMTHAKAAWDKETQWHRNAEYEFAAYLHEDGTVKLHVRYNDFNGFAHTGGGLDLPVIQPYSEARLRQFREDRMFELAAIRYYARQEATDRQAILKLQAAMFGEVVGLQPYAETVVLFLIAEGFGRSDAETLVQDHQVNLDAAWRRDVTPESTAGKLAAIHADAATAA